MFQVQTAALIQAVHDLVGAIRATGPEVAALLDSQPPRVSYCMRTRTMHISLVDRHGYSRPFLVLGGNAFDPTTFGRALDDEPVFTAERDITTQ